MIVFDASTLVSAAFGRGSTPEQAVRRAFRFDRVVVSEPLLTEMSDVLARPKLARFVDPALAAELLWQLDTSATRFSPSEPVRDCRDPKDNLYLELALAAHAERIISSDSDLLVLDPWRGIRILRPSAYLAERLGRDRESCL